MLTTVVYVKPMIAASIWLPKTYPSSVCQNA